MKTHTTYLVELSNRIKDTVSENVKLKDENVLLTEEIEKLKLENISILEKVTKIEDDTKAILDSEVIK